jgi:hypothetical protein
MIDIKGEKMLDIYPTSFTDQISLQERWIPITDSIVPGILEYYSISTWGRVYNHKLNRYYPNENTKSQRYVVLWLKLKNGSGIKIYLHILMLRSFRYFQGCEDTNKYEVNHIDGVKYHNWLWNLEWVTPKENIIHSRLTGLNPSGGDSVISKITNDQARMVAQRISIGMRPREIIKELQPLMPTVNVQSVIYSMTEGKAWKNITKDYNLSNKYRRREFFSDEQIHAICKIFQDKGKDISYKTILDMLGIDYRYATDYEINMYKATVSNIRLKRYKKEICNRYNY